MFRYIFKTTYLSKLKQLKMDSSTTLIGLFIVVLCILPFAWVSYSNKKKKQEIIYSFFNKPDTKVNEFEFCGDMAFAFNETENQVYFYKKTKEQTLKETLRLNDFKSCEVVKSIENNYKNSHKVIKQLDLTFKSKSSHQPDICLPIYTIEESMIIGGELLFAMKWEKEFNKKIQAFV